MKKNIFLLLLIINFHLLAFEKHPFITSHCIECHSNKKSKGKINFEKELNREQLTKVYEAVNSGDMPPEDVPAPDKKEKDEFLEFIISKYSREPVKAVRWMMKEEHEKIIKEIFKYDSFESPLPQRGKNIYGVRDSAGDRHLFNESYFEKLLNCNSELLDYLYPNPKPKSGEWQIDVKDFNSAGEFYINELSDGYLINGFSGPGLQPLWKAEYDGDYIIIFNCEPHNQKAKMQDKLIVSCIDPRFDIVENPGRSNNDTLIKELTIEKSQTVKLKVKLQKGQGIRFNCKAKIKYDRNRKKGPLSGSGLKIFNVKISGPVNYQYARWKSIFPFPKNEYIKNIEAFANKLFRGNYDESVLNDYLKIFELKSKNLGQDLAYKNVLSVMLADIRFLFLDNYDDHLYLNRLAFALNGKFSNAPEKANKKSIINYINTCLNNNDYLLESLARSWLDLEVIDTLAFDKKILKHYRKDLVEDFKSETNHYLKYMLKNNRPISELISSNYNIVNKNLGKYYMMSTAGLKELGKEFVKVPAIKNREMGLLSHASVYTAISNAQADTNPIVRGVWILERFLGKTPPPPPDNVPAVDPTADKNLQTAKQIIEKHKEIKSCNQCHKKFDALGLVLENYDSLGAFRQYYGQPHIKNSKQKRTKKLVSVDLRGEFEKFKFNKREDFVNFLKGEGAKYFKLAFVKILYQHTMSRSLTLSEKRYIEENISTYKNNFRSLLIQILTDKIFMG